MLGDGFVIFKRGGTYRFSLTSDDGSKLFVDFSEVVNFTPQLHITTQLFRNPFISECFEIAITLIII